MMIDIGFLSGCNEQNSINDGTRSQDKNKDNINESYPLAFAYANPESGYAPLHVYFTAIGEDNDGYIVSYNWDFDDGDTSDEQNINHNFNFTGTYDVNLTVIDNEGKIGNDDILITVYGSSDKEDDYTDNNNITEFFEGFESSIIGVYPASCRAIASGCGSFKGDAGIWIMEDNYYAYFSAWPDNFTNPEETSPITIEIKSSQGNKYLFMNVPPLDGIPELFITVKDKFEIPLTPNTTISFEGTYQSFVDDNHTDEVYEGSYQIILKIDIVGVGSISYCYFGHPKYDGIMVEEGLTTRNIYDDYTKVLNHKFKGTEKVRFNGILINYPGQANYDNIHIHN